MSSFDRTNLRELFRRALESPAEELEKLLDDLSPDLRAELKALLRADQDAAAFLERGIATELSGDPAAGERFGTVEIDYLLGRGGMGAVFRAHRVDGEVSQIVAVKVVRSGLLAPRAADRFLQERQFLAGLSHANIARLIDGGTRPDGVAYLIMEYIDGQRIDRFCDQRELSIRQRLELFLPLCDAVDHAHRKLIIHRDLKPSNVLVTDDGRPKLLDFGVAKALDATCAAENAAGATQTVVLTPDFGSPEQLKGEETATATDVYGLGALLYLLLTGSAPHKTEGLSGRALHRAICETPPTKPAVLRAELKGDLENILLKALHLEPERRYPTVRELAEDVQRYLSHRPVRATPDSPFYRARRFVRRNTMASAALLVALLAVGAGLGVSLWQARIARREAQASAAVEKFLTDIFRANSSAQENPIKARQTTARELLDIGVSKIDGELGNASVAKQRMFVTLAGLYRDLGLDDQAVALGRKAVASAKQVYGNDDPRVASALLDLAGALHSSSSVNDEEAVLKEAASTLDRVGDSSSVSRAVLDEKLSEMYQSSDLSKSIAYADQAVAIRRRHPPSADLAEALFLKGAAYFQRGEAEKSIAALEEALVVSRTQEGDPNPSLPRIYGTLGLAQSSAMHFTRAEKSLKSAIAAAVAVNGDDHVDALMAKLYLAKFLDDSSKPKDSLPYFRDAQATVMKTRGSNDPFFTPQVLAFYGHAQGHLGNNEKALPLINEALENRRKNRPGTRFLATLLQFRARTLLEMGFYDQARADLKESAEILQKVNDSDKWRTLSAEAELALATGDVQQAARLVGPEPHMPDSRPFSYRDQRFALLFSEVALAQGNPNAAIRVAGLLRQRARSSAEHNYLVETEASAALFEGRGCMMLHQPKRALPLLERSVEIRMALFDKSSPSLADAEVALAECELEMGKRDAAIKWASDAKTVISTHPKIGRQHSQPLKTLLDHLSVS
jgi:serine/threonine-protein kinase